MSKDSWLYPCKNYPLCNTMETRQTFLESATRGLCKPCELRGFVMMKPSCKFNPGCDLVTCASACVVYTSPRREVCCGCRPIPATLLCMPDPILRVEDYLDWIDRQRPIRTPQNACFEYRGLDTATDLDCEWHKRGWTLADREMLLQYQSPDQPPDAVSRTAKRHHDAYRHKWTVVRDWVYDTL